MASDETLLIADAAGPPDGVRSDVLRPHGEPLPSSGEPQIGTSYRVTETCAVPIEIGDSIWLYAGDYVRDVSTDGRRPSRKVGGKTISRARLGVRTLCAAS